MGLLDDAIREHLDLKRRHGANESEVARQEAEALGPVLREEDQGQESEPVPPGSLEAGPSLPYDRAAEAGLTGEPDIPSFEWYGSSTSEPEVPSFVSPEPLRGPDPEPDGVEPPADAEVASGPTETFAEDDPGLEAPAGVSDEPDDLEVERALQEEEPALRPEPPVDSEPPVPPEPGGVFDPDPGAEPEVSVEPPAESPLPPEHSIEHAVSPEVEGRLAEPPLGEDETAFHPAPTEDDLAASSEPDPFEPVPPLGSDVSEEPIGPRVEEVPPEDEATGFHPAVEGGREAAAGDVEDLPLEPGAVPPEGGAFPLEAEDLPSEPDPVRLQSASLPLEAEEPPPEQEPPPRAAGDVVEEPPIDFGPGEPPIEEPPIEEPFVAGEEEAWREAGEAPGDVSDSRQETPLSGVSSSDDVGHYPAPPLETDPLLEATDEPPRDEHSLQGPAPDAELPTSEPLDPSLDEPLDTAAEPPPTPPADPEAARGFFDETAEHERPRRQERARPVDPDFED